MQKVLFIGKVWPEPTSSAAGSRILQLIDLFISNNFHVTFASTASKSPYSYIFNQINIQEKDIKLNDDSFDRFIQELNPDIVVFDRFMTEEQFGWRVREFCPNAVTILDTEDLHFLRKAREIAYKKNKEINLHTTEAQREIASILKCDLSILISEKEMELLISSFHIPPKILLYIPFLEDINPFPSFSSFEERENLMFIGNFLHEPNYQTVLRLKTEIWPILRKKLPKTELHIYGAYTSEKVKQLNNTKENFIIKGRAKDARETLAKYRLLIAPIPFGAGTKGKFIDAMQSGTPSITTTLGAESMQYQNLWNGFITDENEEFIEKSVELYQNKSLWMQAQSNGSKILKALYDKLHFQEIFQDKLNNIKDNLTSHRQSNFIGEILKTNQFNSSKYMSLWIEAKNKN